MIGWRASPPWTAAEEALMKQVPLHDPDRCAKIFREHGFSRSPTAIVVRAKRLDLSRRYRETLSATQIGKLLGVDGNKLSVVGLDCLDGTPLLDIKPYFASTDSVPDAVVGWHKRKDERDRSGGLRLRTRSSPRKRGSKEA